MGMTASMRRTGGTFREKVSAGLATSLSDITHEGIYGEYFFEVGEEKEANFATTYAHAHIRDPISGERQHYLAVGLNSKYDGDGIRRYGRPRAKVVFVLDISGSMTLEFDKDRTKSKIDAAKESLCDMLQHLKPNDLFALILFNEKAITLQPLARWADINRTELIKKIKDIQAQCGTDLAIGMAAASQMLQDEIKNPIPVPADAASDGTTGEERRIIYLTDMQPTAGEKSPTGLFGIAQANARQGIYATFIGVGLDFNTELVNHITTNITGASYMGVASSAEFKKQIDEDFDYTVCPLVFDVTLKIETLADNKVIIDQIYGSPEADNKSGVLMHIGTLFPSARSATGETKGGVCMIKLNTNGGKSNAPPPSTEGITTAIAPGISTGGETSSSSTSGDSGSEGEIRLKMNLTYTDRDKEGVESRAQIFGLSSADAPYYQNRGVRKAVLLTQYVNLVRSLLAGLPINKTTGIPTWDPRHPPPEAKEELVPDDTNDTAAVDSTPAASVSSSVSDNDRARWGIGGSVRLSPQLRDNVAAFIAHFESEMKELGDLTLRKELTVLNKFIAPDQPNGANGSISNGNGVAANAPAKRRPFMMM